MRQAFRAAAALAAVALLAAGCAKPSSSSGNGTGAGAAAKFTGCMVTDTGGINDKSFNQSAWQGMQEAAAANPAISVKYLQSTTQSDYVPHINTFLGEKCGIIVTVGFLMAQATQAAATKHPGDHFAIVDNAYTPPIKNVDALLFNTVQDGFLGGYLAAGMTKTGKVATFGGQELPTVTIYMDGFWDGVQYYNSRHHKNVQVLGWNQNNQKGGTFTNSFTDQNKGKQISETMIQQGADIIFPVAGGAGLGAGAAAQGSGGRANVIWVDTDGCFSAAQYCNYFLTSVTKNLAGAVKTYLHQAATGRFPKGSYIGTLKNHGTGLAPYHHFATKVPGQLTSELHTVAQDIIHGKIIMARRSYRHSSRVFNKAT